MIRWYIAIIPAAVLLIALIIVAVVLGGRISKLNKECDDMEKLVTQLKLRLSQNQIRPHFIFNSILAIKQLCIEEPREAAKALQHFAVYLRTNLDAMSGDELVPFEREIDCIREYVALEQADPASNFEVIYDIEFADFQIPLLVVEPMVENAIRHGISRSGGGLVKLGSHIEDDKVVITVEDNGVGFGSETRQQAEHRSVGIKNASDRIKILCNGELSIVNTGRGTIVRFVIPLDEKAKL